jgi:hypothetical protein
MRTESGGYRRDYLRALAQRIEVDAQELRIMGSKSELLRTLVAASSAKTAGFGVPSSVPKWRAAGDSNARPIGRHFGHFPDGLDEPSQISGFGKLKFGMCAPISGRPEIDFFIHAQSE